jgi:hypothetical protein
MAPVHRFITLNAFECYVGQMNNAIFDVCEGFIETYYVRCFDIVIQNPHFLHKENGLVSRKFKLIRTCGL